MLLLRQKSAAAAQPASVGGRCAGVLREDAVKEANLCSTLGTSTLNLRRCDNKCSGTPTSWLLSVKYACPWIRASPSNQFCLQQQPELADAAANNPTRFRELMLQFHAMQESARLQQEHESALLNSDPYNVDAQRKIEEAIRQQAVLENMETAMENMPEA